MQIRLASANLKCGSLRLKMAAAAGTDSSTFCITYEQFYCIIIDWGFFFPFTFLDGNYSGRQREGRTGKPSEGSSHIFGQCVYSAEIGNVHLVVVSQVEDFFKPDGQYTCSNLCELENDDMTAAACSQTCVNFKEKMKPFCSSPSFERVRGQMDLHYQRWLCIQ